MGNFKLSRFIIKIQQNSGIVDCESCGNPWNKIGGIYEAPMKIYVTSF